MNQLNPKLNMYIIFKTLLSFLLFAFLIGCSVQDQNIDETSKIDTLKDLAVNDEKTGNNETSESKIIYQSPEKETQAKPMPMQEAQYQELYQKVTQAKNGMVRYESLKELSFARFEQRKLTGDTLVRPLEYYKMLLPDEIEGYETLETKTRYDSSGIFLFAHASRTYSSATDPDQNIIIKISDYVELPQKFYTESAWTAGSLEIESDTGFIKRLKNTPLHVFGQIDHHKEKKLSTLRYAVGYRFDIMIVANNVTNAESVKKAAEKLNFEQMVKL